MRFYNPRINDLSTENKDLKDQLTEIQMENTMLEDKVKELELKVSLAGSNLNNLDNLGGNDEQEYYQQKQNAQAIEEANIKAAEEFKRLQDTIDALKEGHGKFKKSAEDNINKLTEKVSELTSENLQEKALKTDLLEQLEKLKSNLRKELKEKEYLVSSIAEYEKQKQEEEDEANNQQANNTVTGEMLNQLIKVESEMNKYKYKAEQLDKSLMEGKVFYQQQLNSIYSIVFDLLPDNSN